ncbi:MAG TPA: alkaline phosphatase, partial [Saprospiraceae bacterium]|nr:alkaline phosphatase [Saprospiraceae bacterium]
MMIRFLLCFPIWFGFQHLVPPDSPGKPKNIILVIGDGMGLAHIALAEYLHKPPSPLGQMEVIGLQKTHSADNLETDSGAAATAMSCGVKTFNSAIGENADSITVRSIMEMAHDHGMKTGFVVTCSVVHATPAAFYAHVDSRGSYELIAQQLCNANIDVFVGGGERYFYNRATDASDLLDDLKQHDYDVIRSYDTQGKYRIDGIGKEQRIACFTAFEDPPRASSGRNYLPIMAVKAMEALNKRSDNGYFMMVEGSQIDWAAHANDADWLTYEMQDFYDMLALLLKKVWDDGNTLLIVTADHECGYLSLKGKKTPRLEFGSKVHSSQMVPVFATGPGAEEFLGIYENTAIFDKMKALLSLD